MPRHYYYWIVAIRPDAQPVLIFGGDDENAARMKGLEMLSGVDFDIKRFPTRDRGTASAMLRGKRLEGGAGLDRSMERQLHERGLARLKGRIAKRRASEGGF